jgi:hypothetical protein
MFGHFGNRLIYPYKRFKTVYFHGPDQSKGPSHSVALYDSTHCAIMHAGDPDIKDCCSRTSFTFKMRPPTRIRAPNFGAGVNNIYIHCTGFKYWHRRGGQPEVQIYVLRIYEEVWQSRTNFDRIGKFIFLPVNT